VGMTEAQAREAGVEVAVARIDLPSSIARPATYEQNPRGELSVIFDRRRRVMVGAWAVAPLASEWIHQAVLAIKAEVRLEVLLDTVAQFPPTPRPSSRPWRSSSSERGTPPTGGDMPSAGQTARAR